MPRSFSRSSCWRLRPTEAHPAPLKFLATGCARSWVQPVERRGRGMNCSLPAPRVARVVSVVGCLFSLAAVAAGGQAARGRCFPVNVALPRPSGLRRCCPAAVVNARCGSLIWRAANPFRRPRVRPRPAEEQGVPSGFPPSSDGQALCVAERWGRQSRRHQARRNRLALRARPPSPMPAPRRAAFYKAHAKDDDDD